MIEHLLQYQVSIGKINKRKSTVPEGNWLAPGTGLPALEPVGVPLPCEPLTSLIFLLNFLRPASDISAPVASPSLVAPAAFFGRCRPFWAFGTGVEARLFGTEPVAVFLTLLRDDSLPLDSSSDKLGEPGRLRLLTFFVSDAVLGLPVAEAVGVDLGPVPGF